MTRSELGTPVHRESFAHPPFGTHHLGRNKRRAAGLLIVGPRGEVMSRTPIIRLGTIDSFSGGLAAPTITQDSWVLRRG